MFPSTHVFSKHLLSLYYRLGMVLVLENMLMNELASDFEGVIFLVVEDRR